MLSMYSSAYIQTYSSGGNLLSKTGVGGYTYGQGSHMVTSVDNTDDVIPYSSQSITCNAWGKVAEVNETVGSDTYKYELTYGPDLQRVLAVLWKNNTLVHLVTYGDGYEEKYQNGHITYYYFVIKSDYSQYLSQEEINVLTSDEFVSAYDSIANILCDCVISHEIPHIDGNDVSSLLMNLFNNILLTYSVQVYDIEFIINKYIDAIQQTTELNEIDKEILLKSLSVAASSYELWNLK